MQAFVKAVVQLKDPNQKHPDFFLPDYILEPVIASVHVDEQDKKNDEQMMVCAGSVLVNCEVLEGVNYSLQGVAGP